MSSSIFGSAQDTNDNRYAVSGHSANTAGAAGSLSATDAAQIFEGLQFHGGGGATNRTSTRATTCVVSNLTRRGVWNFFVTALDVDSNESRPSLSVQYPALPLSNHVVTVTTAWRECDALGGPWRTNSAVLYQATNPLDASHLWQSVGISLTTTNF